MILYIKDNRPEDLPGRKTIIDFFKDIFGISDTIEIDFPEYTPGIDIDELLNDSDEVDPENDPGDPGSNDLENDSGGNNNAYEEFNSISAYIHINRLIAHIINTHMHRLYAHIERCRCTG